MVSVQSFVRALPRDLFDRMLVDVVIEILAGEVDETDWRKSAKQALSALPLRHSANLQRYVERLGAMCDAAGQTAILSHEGSKARLDHLPGPHARSAWLFQNDQTAFKRAEEIKYSDERRLGRQWDGFVVGKNLPLAREGEALERLKAALRTRFNSPNVHIDIFDRMRASADAADHPLVQAAIYREGPSEDVMRFVDQVLCILSERSVLEAAITYEPSTGAIEIVGPERHRRQEIAQCFCDMLLDHGGSVESLRLRRYALQRLTRPHEFKVDPEDGISGVRVSSLRLQPAEREGERVQLECLSSATRDIWTAAQDNFGEHDPLSSGWWVRQAKLVVKFASRGGTRARSLPPHHHNADRV